MNKVSRGPRTKARRMIRSEIDLMGGKQTIVNSSANETGESEGAVEDTVGGVRQSNILKTSSS